MKKGGFMFSKFVVEDHKNILMNLDLKILCWDFQYFKVGGMRGVNFLMISWEENLPRSWWHERGKMKHTKPH